MNPLPPVGLETEDCLVIQDVHVMANLWNCLEFVNLLRRQSHLAQPSGAHPPTCG